MPIEKEPLRRFFRCGEDRPLKKQIRPPLRWPGEVPISQVMTCMRLKNTPKKTSSPKKICMNLGEWTSRGLIHIQREARDSRRPFPSIQWYHVFWERNIKRGVLALLWYQKDTTYVIHFVVLKKVPHMWYKNEHRGIKRYHICGTFCRCEYKRTVFRQSFFVFWVHQHDKNKCRNGHLSDLFWQHCYSSEWQWMGFLGGTCSP